MRTAQAHVLGLLIVSLTLPGCPALDWDFEGAGGGAGSGGQAGAGGAGGEGGAGGQGGEGTGNEDCANGTDDDGDGKVDCKDEECILLYECAAPVPAGWSPVWALEGELQDPMLPSTCPDGQAPTTLYAEPSLAWTCSACGCSFTGATCTAPAFDCDYTVNDCSSAKDPIQPTSTMCYDLPNVPSNSVGSCVITSGPVVNNYGDCSGEASAAMGPMWLKELRLCPAPTEAGAGCSSLDVCTEKRPGVLQQARTCIVKAGSEACPLGWQATQISAYQGGTDGRGCTSCGCDKSSITCSGGSVTFYGENGCVFMQVTLAAINMCSAVKMDNSSGSADFVLGTPAGGTCVPPQPTGGVVPDGPHSLCCR